MCELQVIMEEKIVFKDAIYAKADESRVIVKNILGDTKTFENCRIVEININTERLVLFPTSL